MKDTITLQQKVKVLNKLFDAISLFSKRQSF